MKKWKTGERVLYRGNGPEQQGIVVYVLEHAGQLVIRIDGQEKHRTVPMVACVAVSA